MLPIIARWSIAKGHRAEALRALDELVALVEENEPFVPMYTVNVPNMSPELTSFPTPSEHEVVFLSVFDDAAAFKRHMDGVFKQWLDANKQHFLLNNGNLFVVSEWLERHAGFIRQAMVTTGSEASS
ncbi:MAG TPA: antibiotic biosynthesis monooxygenase [Allosphingosinicella sp.]|jgi:quinol monooxygenase YgiN